MGITSVVGGLVIGGAAGACIGGEQGYRSAQAALQWQCHDPLEVPRVAIREACCGAAVGAVIGGLLGTIQDQDNTIEET